MPRPTKFHRIAPAILQRSRDFRHPLTPTENMVWQAVRRRQHGFKLRRWHPLGKLIAESRLGVAYFLLYRPVRSRR